MSHVEGDARQFALRTWGFSVPEEVPCVGCSGYGGVVLHHYVLKSQGGTDEPDNLLPLCEQRCHIVGVHAERFQLVWKDGIVYRREGGEITAQTPWPPNYEAMGIAVSDLTVASLSLQSLHGAIPKLIAPELTVVAQGLHALSQEAQHDLMFVAWSQLQMAPKGQRSQAATDLGSLWRNAGLKINDTEVHDLANEYELMLEVSPDVWEATPKTVRRHAARRSTTTAAGVQEIGDWHDRPAGQTQHQFFSERLGNPPTCSECGGSGKVLECPHCEGTGREP